MKQSRVYYTERTRPVTKGEVFDYLYCWTWVDENGEVREDRVDQAAQVSSVQYVTAQEIVDNFDLSGFSSKEESEIVDFSGLDNPDLPSIIRYLADLQISLQESYAKFSSKEDGKSSEIGGQVVEEGGEVAGEGERLGEGGGQ